MNTEALWRRKTKRNGLTLIELVMVLIILAALTALIVPIIDSLRRTSDKTTGAAGMKQVIENVSLYRTMKGNYPNQFDSLLLADGTEYSAVKGSGKWQPLALTDDEAASLTKVGIGSVMDHDPASPDTYRGLPGNSGVVERPVASGGQVAIVTDVNIVASIYPDEVAAGLFDADSGTVTIDVGSDGSVGGTDDTTARIVALGVGPRCTAVGKTMVSVPAYQGVDGMTEYNRFIAMFAVYELPGNQSQKRAQIKGALDSSGDFLNQELSEIDENEIE